VFHSAWHTRGLCIALTEAQFPNSKGKGGQGSGRESCEGERRDWGTEAVDSEREGRTGGRQGEIDVGVGALSPPRT
jgi:hypothetical protein